MAKRRLRRRPRSEPSPLPEKLPNVPRRPTCIGINAITNVRHPPLRPCKAESIEGSPYCKLHDGERERQEKLRQYLKPGWETGLVGKRGGAPRKEHREAKQRISALTGDLPPLPPPVVAPLKPPPAKRPATVIREGKETPRASHPTKSPEVPREPAASGQAREKRPSLPTYTEALRKLGVKVDSED